MERLKQDLGNHFADRLRALLGDGADTFRRAGMSNRDTVDILLACLTAELVAGCHTLNMNRDSFADFARVCWDEIEKQRVLQAGKKRRRPAPRG